ncbi:uncharacterized protein F5Z01DRAFT_675235 [Emericellopsis atlantica]|uniref:Uncharacterized protein n=1 Tax=Emericellopsis atlantica TaxID=2614577 RepID=A0A9P7ZJL9_9HYPO|nr:uncharacterized protein F5Z01DRAFT_675235 [Emericellopsis atlantica]KAG9253324.1 hypothetical protein F5Z01DRAFT_675235 [Emericellopsis atlantica]
MANFTRERIVRALMAFILRVIVKTHDLAYHVLVHRAVHIGYSYVYIFLLPVDLLIANVLHLAWVCLTVVWGYLLVSISTSFPLDLDEEAAEVNTEILIVINCAVRFVCLLEFFLEFVVDALLDIRDKLLELYSQSSTGLRILFWVILNCISVYKRYLDEC